MFLYILIIIIFILFIIYLVVIRSQGEKQHSWVQFYAKGKDAGFGIKEIELLRRAAVKAELPDPSALFWSEKQLDLCIKALLKRVHVTGEDRNKETQDFIARLYEYRKKIEFEHPRYKRGISSSRSISDYQQVRILVEGVGVMKSHVFRSSDRFLSIVKPIHTNLPASFQWKGHRLAVYFWRKDDAGYVFDTYVLEEAKSGNTSVLHLAHSDSLFRTQKRKSIRTKTRKSAYLYLMKGEEPPEKIEVEPGLRCVIENLSETGYALTIGGKAQKGLRVKIQFDLDGQPVVMPGTVRSVQYDEEKDRSILHIEADNLSLATKNRILAEVFGVRPEDKSLEELPHLNMENNDFSQSVQPDEALEELGGVDEE